MANDNFDEIIKRSIKIRKLYNELELKQNGKVWTVEQDALGFLSDAGLVGRNIMSHEKTWSKANSDEELEHKLAESIWWIINLSDRMEIDIKVAMEKFLSKTEKLF
ncbi:hypothetical protein D3C87_335120 [compost metagenome]